MSAATANTISAVISAGAAVRRDGMQPGGGWGPWIEKLDVAGADLSRLSGAPLLLDHLPRSDMVIGAVDGGRLVNGQIVADMRFSSEPRAQSYYRDVKDKIRQQLSCGYDVQEWVRQDDKKSGIPTFSASKWRILEVSLVPVGADEQARFRSSPTSTEMRFRSMSVQTSSPAAEEAPVTTNTMLPPDPLLVERERAGGILNSARLLKVDSAVASDLIARGVPLADARAALIDAAAAVSRATQVNTVVAGIDYTDPAGIAEDVATVLAHRLHSGVELKGRAREMRGLRAAQLVGELMSARGIRVNRFDTDRSLVTRAGMMTTSDLPMVLASSLNKALLPQFEQARSGLRNVARPDSARDFKTVTRHRVGEFPQLLKVAEHGEYQSGAVGEAREAFQLEKFGRILSLSWEMVIGDDLEALSTSTSSAALAAATLEADQLADAVTSNPVLSDGVQVYHSTHNNVGTPATIGNGSVGELSAKMRTMKGLDGRTVLNIAPAYIVVPAAIEYAALQLVSSAVVAEQASNVNVWTALTPVVEPRLDAVDNNAWYLFASPGAAPTLSIAYLEGEETPMVETKQGFEIDGVHIKVRWALKPYWAGYRGTAYNAGA